MSAGSPFPATVLFDLDGTLLDTAADFAAVLDRMATEAGTEPPGEQQLHHTVSAGAHALVTLTLGLQPDEPGFDYWHRRLLELYGGQIEHSRATLYAGLETSLRILEDHGVPWGVVTNKPEAFTRALLRGVQLEGRCSVTICPEHVRKTKPDPEALLLACRTLQCPAAGGLYIGDHPRDIQAGRAAGMRTAVAGWGYLPAGSDPADWGADHILANAGELASRLSLHESREPS